MLSKLNVFDFLFVVFLCLGIVRGRKNGMSGELFHVVQWIAVLLGCAFLYDKVSPVLAGPLHLSTLTANMFGYVAMALFILGLFALVRRALGSKLAGSDFFGHSEYFLGMASGLVRYGCIALAGLALLNARYFSPTEVRASEKFQNENYGSNLFPTWYTAQSMVFEKSFCGQLIRQRLHPVLIRPTEAVDTSLHQKELAFP